jgi:DnaJ-class molecular chaperone
MNEEAIQKILEENVWGVVCNECGGGGSKDGDCNKKCPKCNGTGIYNWNYDLAVKKILELAEEYKQKLISLRETK